MKPNLFPHDSDYKTLEVFTSEGGVGLRVLNGQTVVRLTREQWRRVVADGDARILGYENNGRGHRP